MTHSGPQPWSTSSPTSHFFLPWEGTGCYHGRVTGLAAVNPGLPPFFKKVDFLSSLFYGILQKVSLSALDMSMMVRLIALLFEVLPCLPSFTHPSSPSPLPPGKCLFTSQSPKTNAATFSTKTSSVPKAKLFALSLLPFYTHLSSSSLYLQK